MAMKELDRFLIMVNEAIEMYESIENKDEAMNGFLEGVKIAKSMAERLKNKLEKTK